MSNSLELSLKSRIYKGLQAALKMLGYGVSGFYFLALGYFFLWNFYSALWVGEPIAMTCYNVDFTSVDCRLRYRALIRESEQRIKDVRGTKVETSISLVDQSITIRYRVSLKTHSGDRFIKEYSDQNDPKLQALQRRLKPFIENPEKHLALPL